jgi:hypothetical protein
MIIIEFILELIIWFFVEIIFQGLIIGTWNLFKKVYDFFKYSIFGMKRSSQMDKTIRALDRQLLYKRIELTADLNTIAKKGQIGTIMEVIDNETVFAEFYDMYNRKVKYNNELVFKITLNQFKLVESK